MFKTETGLLARFALEERSMPIMDDESDDFAPADEMRCVAVIDTSLPTGKAANAAAVMALTMGARHPHLVGQPLTDASGNQHPGLIPIGIAVLGAPESELAAVREKARSIGMDVVDFPVQGQQTNDYAQFQNLVRATAPGDVRYLGVMIYGEKRKVARIVGRYRLLTDRSSAVATGAL